ncbi:exopolysaccharide biosynthesis protein [soil metagenome]
MDEDETHAVTRVLDDIESAGDAQTISVGDIVTRMGGRSFAPLLLVPALLLVSPISAIPGTPTLSALIIGLVAGQMLAGRETIWLPRFIKARALPRRRMERAVEFLRKPVGWVEPMMRPRLTWLAERPGSYLALAICLAVTLVMPAMEFVPALASIAALAISLIAAGLLARDGALVLAGYLIVGIGALVARLFILGAQEL